MDLDVDFENIHFPDEDEPAHENVQHFSTIVVQDEIIYDDDPGGYWWPPTYSN
jgi:hypothetical protein